MWILPKQLHTSAFVPDTEALISDLNEQSQACAQSLLVRSKPSPVKTWSRRLKQGSLTLLPYGRTLRPSLGKAFETEWTSLVEASLVSHLAPQGDEQETATLATCGPSLPVDLDEWGTLPLFSWKTLKVSSAPNSKAQSGQTQRGRLFCSMSSENWKDWVIKRRREYSARARSAHPISESECSSWAVAPISVQRDEGSLIGCSERQSQQAEKVAQVQPTQHQEAQSSSSGNHQGSRWATPTAGTKDHDSATVHSHLRRLKMGKQVSLAGQILIDMNSHANWTTPTTRDYKGMYPQWSQESENKLTRSLLPDQAHSGTYKGKLNPRWVETLMGLPVGWTMPSCATPWTIEQTSSDCSEMELCPPQQSERLESCGDNSQLSDLERILGPDIMRRFEALTDSLEIPHDDAEANMFALDQVLNNRDMNPWVLDE